MPKQRTRRTRRLEEIPAQENELCAQEKVCYGTAQNQEEEEEKEEK